MPPIIDNVHEVRFVLPPCVPVSVLASGHLHPQEVKHLPKAMQHCHVQSGVPVRIILRRGVRAIIEQQLHHLRLVGAGRKTEGELAVVALAVRMEKRAGGPVGQHARAGLAEQFHNFEVAVDDCDVQSILSGVIFAGVLVVGALRVFLMEV